eukprot:4141968-Pyramimonas_sp.AAC.2
MPEPMAMPWPAWRYAPVVTLRRGGVVVKTWPFGYRSTVHWCTDDTTTTIAVCDSSYSYNRTL